jgi:hypothetical protein
VRKKELQIPPLRYPAFLSWWSGWGVAGEARIGHTALCLGVLHEGLPYEGSACIFRHEHGDAGVDADDVIVIPVFQWIEGIDEAVAAPGLRVTASDVFQHTHGGVRQERQRASRGCRDYGPINRAHGRWAAPDHVTFVGVGSSDAPEIVAVIGKVLAQLHAEAAVHIGGDGRVLEVVSVLVALMPEIGANEPT